MGVTVDPSGASKAYVDAQDAANLIAAEAYADSLQQDFDIKDPVAAATTGALPFSPTYANGSSGVGATLTGTVGVLAFDGYTPALNDRVLVKNQASAFQNGIYKVTTVGTIVVGYVLTRTTDFNQTANVIYGDTVAVLNGTVNANQQFTMNNNNVITVGTTSITWAQTSGGSQLIAGQDILITGNTVSFVGTVSRVLGSAVVDLNASGAHVTVYTVPSGRRLVIQDFILRDFSTHLINNCNLDIQGDGTSVLASGAGFSPADYGLDVDVSFQLNKYDWQVLNTGILNTFTPELIGGKIVRTEINNPEGSALTCRIDLIGYLVDSTTLGPV